MPDAECAEEESEAFRSFLDTLQADHIRLVVKTDPLIKELARRQVRRLGFNQSRFGQIRNKVREVARLLLKLREISALENGFRKDFLKAGMFSAVVEATRQIAGYQADEFAFKIPSLANKLGQTIKLCADMLEAQAVETWDEVLKIDAQGYLKLHQMSWNEEISAHASRNLYEKKKGHVKHLPLLRDVAKLSCYLSSSSDLATKTLSTAHGRTEIKEAWKSPADVTLTQIILFNRRRSGEASRMKLEDMNQQGAHDEDILESLSNFEKTLCSKFTRIETTGKRSRIVPVLLTKQMKSAVDVLVQKRDDAGVSSSNKFVFVCTFFQSEGEIRGCDALRKFVALAHLAHPQLITSTSLRKQVATMSQIVSLKDNELGVLAQFMGHDVRTHREHYRLSLDMMQLAKVSKLLLALEKGKLQDHQHCTLDEMEMTEDEDVTSEEEAAAVPDGRWVCLPEPSTSGRSPAEDTRAPAHSQSSPPNHQPAIVAADSSTDEEYEEYQSEKIGRFAKPKKFRPMATRSNSSQSRRTWSVEEVTAVETHLLKYIVAQVLPGKGEIQTCLQAEKNSKHRTWLHVKNYIRNKITSLHRKQRK